MLQYQLPSAELLPTLLPTLLPPMQPSPQRGRLPGAQPAVSATFLLNRGFLHGQVPTDPAARRVVRSIHAVHRESLAVFPG